MNTAFVGWRNPVSQLWYPVGRLTSYSGLYAFVYTVGALRAQQESGFQAFLSFPDKETVYVAESLFPLFINRMIPRSRPEYRDYLRWMGLPESESNPIRILTRSGGRRVTDTLEVFSRPELDENGAYYSDFLVRDIDCTPGSAVERIASLQEGESLLTVLDVQDSTDPNAVALKTAEEMTGDTHIIGYCPRYLQAEFRKILCAPEASLSITVRQLNPIPAPSQFRVLCRASMACAGVPPFSGREFDTLVGDADERIALAHPLTHQYAS